MSIDPLETQGRSRWLATPKTSRNRFVLCGVAREDQAWVRVLICLALAGDRRAGAAVRRLFVKRNGKFHVRAAVQRRAVPVALELFIGRRP